MAKSYKLLSVRDILHNYEFSHRFYSYFASQVAKDACQRYNCTHKDSLHAIDIAERFGLGEDISQEVRDTAAHAAYAAAHAVAAHAPPDHYKPLLLECIQKRLSKVERIIILGEE